MAHAFPHALVFVVQFSSDAELDQACLVGRVEHVESGRSARFASGEEMNQFFARVLREIEEPRSTNATHDCGRNQPGRSR